MDIPENPPAESEKALRPIDGGLIRLFIENQSSFKAFLRRQLPSDAIAEDLLQQGLLKAIKGDSSLAEKESAVAWFYRILRNSLTDFYRSRAAEGRKNDALLQDLLVSGEDHVPSMDAEMRKDICACMNQLIPALKPEYAELIQRIDLGEEAPSDVAESTGITYNNLMVRLHRARHALRVSLERTCGVCTKHGCLDCTCKS
jgi:RNA polymerase sigma-70 factor (ECF subfamily)